jgi:peptide/nickel transport system substrate-binding protein
MRKGITLSAALLATALTIGACSSGDTSDGKEDSGKSGIAAGPSAGANDVYGPPADSPVKGGTVTVASLTEPPSLDPYHQASDARIQYTTLMYQGLMYESASGTALPLLAKKVKLSDDGLTYTFTLNEGVTFHTGAPMTSADVKYSYDYIRDPANGSPGASDFQTIASIDTPDATTVVMTLKQPNSAMLMTLTNKYGGVVPSGYFDAPDAAAALNKASVGTGPYKLKALEPNSSLTLERNKDYWGSEGPYLDELVFQFMPTSAAIVVAMQNGRADLAVLPRIQDAQQLATAKNIAIETFPSLNQKSLDLDSDYGPLKDVRVRRAIAMSIDKKVVAQAAAPKQHQVIGTIPAAMQEAWGLPLDEVPLHNRDVAGAKKLLAEAGYPDGLELELTTINTYDWMNPAAVVITQQLAEAGITVKTTKVELGTWIQNFQNKHMGFTMNDWGTQPDPSLLFYRHFHMRPGGSDFRNWNNEKASNLLDEGIATADHDERVAIYQDFQKELAETVPTVMLYSPEYVVARNTKLTNYVEHPTGWWFGLTQAYLAK